MAIVLPDFSPAQCEECGMGVVNHGMESFSLRVDAVADFITRPFEAVFSPFLPLLERVMNRFAPPIASVLFSLGLAMKVSEPDKHWWETELALFTEARRRGIDFYEVRFFGLPRRYFIAKRGKRQYFFEGIPRLPRRQPSTFWIDDKATLKKRFLKAGFPVPRGGSASSAAKALRIFRKLRKPVIVKPREGSGGRHTNVNIFNEEELLAAYKSARMVAPSVIVEEQIAGPVYRPTLVNKKLVGVLRRDPPTVMGDGKSTIRQLIEEENKNPLRKGPVFAVIEAESAPVSRELARQGLNLESIPEAGRPVTLHFKVNWAVGGTSRDATGETHPDNKALFEEVGKYLGEDIVGIDFIIEDIGKSWRDVPSGIIECNSLPLIGNHHFPYTGPVVNVAGAIWDMVFPE